MNQNPNTWAGKIHKKAIGNSRHQGGTRENQEAAVYTRWAGPSGRGEGRPGPSATLAGGGWDAAKAKLQTPYSPESPHLDTATDMPVKLAKTPTRMFIQAVLT